MSDLDDLTQFTLTGLESATIPDSGDAGSDLDSVGCRVGVTITARPEVVYLQTTPPRIHRLRPLKLRIEDGVLVLPGGVVGDVRLVANTAVLGITGQLLYDVKFGTGVIGGDVVDFGDQNFTFAAPTTDVAVDLSVVERLAGNTPSGTVLRMIPDRVRLNEAGQLVWSANGIDIPDPLTLNLDVSAAIASAVTTAVNALIAGAPGALDTLNELAAALGDDANFAATVATALANRQPLDADLTAIAALTTTTFGRSLLTTADAAAARDTIQGPSYFRRARTVPDPNGTDDTTAVRAVFSEGPGEIVFRKGGTWIIDCNPTTGMLTPQSNTRVIIEEGATVQVKTNALDVYNLFKLNGVSNVQIEGAGTLLGDSATHTGSTGYYGHLILISNGSSDCRVVGPLLLKQAWGDGINMGGLAVSYDVLVDGVIVEDCRRQGMGPTWVDGCTIRNSKIFNISQTGFNPIGCTGDGIDIEPNAAQYVDHITVDNCTFTNTAGLAIAALGHFGPVSNVKLRNNTAVGCASNSGATAQTPYGMRIKLVDNAELIDNTITGSGWSGTTAVANLALTQANRAMVKGGYYADAKGPGIYIDTSTYVTVTDAVIHNNLRRGIYINASDDTTIRNNDILDNCQDADASTGHVHVVGASNRTALQANTFRGSLGGAWAAVIAPAADTSVANNIGLGTSPTNKLSNSGTNTTRSGNFHVASGVYESWDTTGSTPMGSIELGHATDTTVARISAGRASLEGAEVITSTAAAAISAKTTPVDADLMVVFDSAASNAPKQTTWANIKTTLQAWLGLLPSGTEIALHNQTDQTTNYEVARHHWTGNVYTIATEAGGTGTARTLSIQGGSGGSMAAFATTQGPTVGTVRIRATGLSAASATIAGVNGTLSGASGVQYGLAVAPTHTQSSTAGYTALLVNSTETSTGSGSKLLADFQVGGTSKASIDNTGVVTVGAVGTAAGSLVSVDGTQTLTNKTLTSPAVGGTASYAQSAALASYNTSDQTTNYERARMFWSSNIFTIAAEQGGTGTLRDINITAAGSVAAFGSTQGPTVGTIRQRASLSAANGTIAGINGTLSASSGTQYAQSISPTFTQTSTAGYTALLINATETSTGSGTKLLADFQVGGSSKASVSNAGVVSAVASGAAATVPVYAAVPATATSTGTTGQIARDANFVYFCTATNTWVRAALATW